ncbi:transcription factor E2F7 [Xyrichtys novacula]|uniref:Transcription factor E2F7 n=1 Tax=Xyrichtys novacula TaxID=13765 RepID=A0AAV1EZA0_XYRNO|nr:transcription factor E2F7 [Xyrichtys novacula]
MEVECLALKDLTSPRKKSFKVESEEDGGHSEQKENICTERRKSTPLKSTESPTPLLIFRKVATPDLAHITPIKHTVLTEPWTPTANLKMLISAASPDIRDREMKKVLFRPIENEKEKPASPQVMAAEDAEVEDSCQLDEEDDADKKPSRKQKSLGLLCQKFLALYPDYPPPHSPIWISLDEVASSLGVERRRIYDIVNVLESLTIVGRIAKNSYTWYGRQRLEATLEDLQRRGLQQGYHLQMEMANEAREAAAGCEDDGAEGDANSGSNRKDKSLRIMSQKFVMLFLVSKTQTVTLDAAAKVLIEESQDSSSHSKYKTKVRRLYDIANVLTSLDLIKKVHVREERGRKPAFTWLGPVEFKNSGSGAVTLPGITQPITKEDIRQLKMPRHASFNVTPTSAAVQRQVSSAPSSPRRNPAGPQHQPVDYSKKMTNNNNNTACQVRIENSTEIRPGASLQTSSTCSSRSSPLPPSTSYPTLLASSLPTEQQLFANSPSPHCLAYLPSLSQPSVVMLYRAPDRPEGQRSPGSESEEGRKRKREEREEEEEVLRKKKGISGLEENDKMRPESAECRNRTSPDHPAGLLREQEAPESPAEEPAQPSHYLYVPNNAGLSSFNFLLTAGQTPAGLALPSSSVATVPLPYILVPSAALPHYPLVAGGLQQQTSETHNNLSFSLPAVMSPAHFMVGAAPFGLAAPSEVGRSIPSPSTPEQGRMFTPATGAPQSPSGTRHTVSINTPEPLTPHTPKEAPLSASKAFFQTPGTLGNVVSAVPAARKRGSAQRRLDVGHPPPPTC